MEEKSFAGYNGAQAGPRKTIIGNWYEERKLEELTGHNRFPTWAPLGDTKTVYATRAKLPIVPTHPRTMMTERGQGPSQWCSTNRAHFLTESEAADNPETFFYPRDQAGPRAAMAREEMMRKARDLPPPPSPERCFDTTHRVEHCSKEITGPIGRRTMKTRGGAPISLADRDLTFLAESGISAATDTGRWGATRAEAEPDGALACAAPITIYSEAAKAGALAGTTFFGTSRADSGAGPTGVMGRTREFSKPVGDMTKGCSEDWGDDWPPGLPARQERLHQHTTLPKEGAALPGPNGTTRGRTGPGGWAEYGGRNVPLH